MPDHYQEGRLVARWDDTTRVFRLWNILGAIIEERPYTTAENLAAEQRIAQAAEDGNRATIEAALSQALIDLQTIIDSTNATINQNPAVAIKTVARGLRRTIRLVIRRFDGTA